jgi:uncharacterized protein
MSRSLTIDRQHARRFALHAVRLARPAQSVGEALRHHGYVQLDPINVCGRIHDLILRNRVVGYREGELLAHVHSAAEVGTAAKRNGFEHYIPGAGILAAWPAEAVPYVLAHLQRRASQHPRHQLNAEEQILAEKILAHVSEHGPTTSDDIVHEGSALTAWGTPGRLAKIVLERLFGAGRLLITQRKAFRRVYDLPERILGPAPVSHLPSEEELDRWLILLRLRQRRLATLRKIDAETVADHVQPISIQDATGQLYCLKSDLPLLDETAADLASPPVGRTLLLAPLDPLIYDRALTRRLWDFDYTWEVYTPPEIRKRGYYSLPVLTGTELVGDVEPRADWGKRRLRVVSRRIRRGHTAREAVAELAGFLGLRA